MLRIYLLTTVNNTTHSRLVILNY